MEQVRQQGDKERHLLRLDKDKEHDRLTEQNDQLQSVNQGLRKEIASMEEHLVEVQQEATSEHGSLIGAQDVRELVNHASDHSVYDSLPVGSQPLEEGGESMPSLPPVMSAEEQTASAPIVGVEQPLSGPMNMSRSTMSVEGSSGHPTSPSML